MQLESLLHIRLVSCFSLVTSVRINSTGYHTIPLVNDSRIVRVEVGDIIGIQFNPDDDAYAKLSTVFTNDTRFASFIYNHGNETDFLEVSNNSLVATPLAGVVPDLKVYFSRELVIPLPTRWNSAGTLELFADVSNNVSAGGDPIKKSVKIPVQVCIKENERLSFHVFYRNNHFTDVVVCKCTQKFNTVYVNDHTGQVMSFLKQNNTQAQSSYFPPYFPPDFRIVIITAK